MCVCLCACMYVCGCVCMHVCTCVCVRVIVGYVDSRGVRLIGSEKEVGVSLSSTTILFT